MPGSGSSADFWCAMNTCSPPTTPSSISLASGSPYGNVYETRSSDFDHNDRSAGALHDPVAQIALASNGSLREIQRDANRKDANLLRSTMAWLCSAREGSAFVHPSLSVFWGLEAGRSAKLVTFLHIYCREADKTKQSISSKFIYCRLTRNLAERGGFSRSSLYTIENKRIT